MDANFSFQSLTPELQLDALASIEIYPETGLMPLNSYENRVFLFTDENKIRYVVKFYRPERWSKLQLLEDHSFSQELYQQECHVSPPVDFNGKTLFDFQGYYFALFTSLSARTMEHDNVDILFDLGNELGKMHRIAAQSNFIHRQPLTLQTMLKQPIAELQQSRNIPKAIRQPLFSILETLQHEVASQFSANESTLIRLHGDCHVSNILVDHDLPYLVDFDDCKMGPAVQDLWMLISGDKQEKQLQLAMLLEGYQEQCDFNLDELKLIEPLRTMRIINYVSWINKRWSDPAFPKNFPWFTTEQYWKDLLQSLQQQLIILKEPTLSLQPNY
jgi:Ser/Thr protein kinase RdoA (MazF antagonist)